MALDFEIETAPFKKIPIFLDDIKNKAFPVANRNALNRSLTTLRENMAKNTMKHYKLKKKELKDSYFTMFRARGNRVEQQVATLKVSGRPISLIRFIPKGKRKPADQKGKSIKQRRPLRIEIRPGNKKKTKLFIQKGKGGMTHVFRRKEGKNKAGRKFLQNKARPHFLNYIQK
jgi:hypothetical protein